jgi:beta-glucanase (GH16 family)
MISKIARYVAAVASLLLLAGAVSSAAAAEDTGLPAARLLSTSAGLVSKVDATALSTDWAKYYGRGLIFTHAYAKAASKFTLTWLVTDAKQKPLANQSVTLQANKAYGSSNAHFAAACVAIGNFQDRDGADISGITDSTGHVSFEITNLDLTGEPSNTDTSKPDQNANPVYGQFSLQIANLTDLQQSKEIVEVHILGNATATTTPFCAGWVPPKANYAKWTTVAAPKTSAAKPSVQGHVVSKLLWSDEFSGKSATVPNSKVWTSRYCGTDPANGGASYCNGDQYNIPSANRHDGAGHMKILTNRISSAPANYGDCQATFCPFTSGRFDSQGKLSVQYGYIEARIKLPDGIGQNPAFWMLGDSITRVGWPTSGEIDIMEQPLIGDYQNAGSLHYSNTSGGCCDNHITFTRYFNHTQKLASAYHTFAIAWLPGKVEFFFDGELYGVETRQTASTNFWPFDAPEFLIFDNTTPGPKAQMNWQSSSMLIDWVRVWSLDGQGRVYSH